MREEHLWGIAGIRKDVDLYKELTKALEGGVGIAGDNLVADSAPRRGE